MTKANGTTTLETGPEMKPLLSAERKRPKPSSPKTPKTPTNPFAAEGVSSKDAGSPGGDLASLGFKIKRPLMARKCKSRKNVEWVAEHLEIEMTQKIIDDAPSTTAVGMWVSYSWHPARKAEFWDKMYPKLLPTKGDLNKDQGRREDGVGTIKHIDRILNLHKEIE